MAGMYGEVLGSSASIETRAHEVLDALDRRAASSASAICLWDPIGGGTSRSPTTTTRTR